MENTQVTRIMVPLGKIVDHPAHDRTREDPLEMARLTLQVHTRGLDVHKPILVTQAADGTFPAIAGHRRRTAALLNEEVTARAAEDGGIVDLDFIYQVLADLVGEPDQVEVCAECGSRSLGRRRDLGKEAQALCQDCREWVKIALQDAVYISPVAVAGLHDKLAEQHGHVEVDVALYEGDEKAQVLTLQADNWSQEEPDLLGQAHSFGAARSAGATAAEIAGNIGKTESYVTSVLALNEMPHALQETIVEGEYALGIASQITRLQDEVQRCLVAKAVLESDRCTVSGVREIVSGLLDWQPPTVPLDPDMDPDDRNEARLVTALWHETLEEDPERAWTAAVKGIRHGSLRVQWLSGHEKWLSDDEMGQLLAELVAGCTCQHCQLRDLLAQAPPLSSSKYRCQHEEDPAACMWGVFAGDPFHIQLPWAWDEYPGAKKGGSIYPFCDSPDDFQTVIEARVAALENEDEAEEDEYTYVPPPRAQEAGDVAQQRALIADFMQRHSTLSGADHPWATNCASCQYRLDGSPTKDPDVPHCQWAARRRVVQFFVRAPVDGQGPEVAWCRQYAPTKSWDELIPAHPAPPGVPREWMVTLIQSMANQVKRDVNSTARARQTCEFLTGRPMRSSDSHGEWFKDGLQREIGNLSDGQLWTLATWAGAEWMYRFNPEHRWRYLMPLPDGRVLWYKDTAWEMAEDEVSGEDEEQGDGE